MINTNELIHQAIDEIEQNKSAFPSLKTSILLYKFGVTSLADTPFRYVFNCEETDMEHFDVKGDIDNQIAQLDKETQYEVSSGEPYAEFTVPICPALTMNQLEAKL